MSMMACKDCSTWIDVKQNPEAFYLTDASGNETQLDYVLCEPCKEHRQTLPAR